MAYLFDRENAIVSGQIIAVVNNKGGVGKTTVTVNLSHALTRQGQRVLVVDMDPQCNSTSILLQGNPESNTVYDVYTERDLHLAQCIHPTNYEQLDCLPNTQYTSALEPNLLRALPDSFRIIRQRIRSYVQDHYDYAILDCPPNMGFFVVSALQASDFVVVPIKSGSAFSVQGLMKAIDLIHEIQETGNPDLRFLRLLINQVDRRTTTSKVTIAQVEKHFPEDQVFDTMVPTNAAFERAEGELKTIIRYDPASFGAKAYRSLAKEVLDVFDRQLVTA